VAPAPVPAAPASAAPVVPAATTPLSAKAGRFLFYDDFEKGFAKWVFSAPTGEVGFRALNEKACRGEWALLLGTEGHEAYAPVAGEHTMTLREPLDLGGAKKPYFKYDYRSLITPADAVMIGAEVREPGGAWQPLGEPMDGGYPYMLTVSGDLAAFAGKKVELRFRAKMTAGTVPSKGAYVDDVEVTEPG
jgi:hypothetical protein